MKRLLTLILLVMSTQLQAEMVVVVHKDSAVDALNQQQISNIFLAKTNRTTTGLKVTPVELINSDYKRMFYGKITKKTLSQINSYWMSLIFTGKGKPPKKLENVASLIEELSVNSNAISYLPAEQTTTAMKVIYTFP